MPIRVNSAIACLLFLIASGFITIQNLGFGFCIARPYKARPTLIFSERIKARSRWAIRLLNMS